MKSPVDGLISYLYQPSEKADEDLVLTYFRNLYLNFSRQEQHSDGYLEGHFVLEIKSKREDWFSGLLQGLAYKRELAFSLVVVVTQGLLAIWKVDDIPEDILKEIYNNNSAASKIGKEFAKKYKSRQKLIYKKAMWSEDKLFDDLFSGGKKNIIERILSFEENLSKSKKIRQRITTQNFIKILMEMVCYFERPIKTAGAFYRMIYGWNENSILDLSNRDPKKATLCGETIEYLKPQKRFEFKKFVEDYYICLDEKQNFDDFYVNYDKALDAVDRQFRIKHGIFFTDLDLSKFVLWYIKEFAKDYIDDLGETYIVIDPACGSGNLVTSWKSPLKLRHKIISEIEPELLYAVERRLARDYNQIDSDFTVVPKVEKEVGLNFLDKSADEYIKIINEAIEEKGKSFDKPIAFLCNPPYRGDDDKTAESIDYKIHQTILDSIGGEAVAERYCCFIAQMKLICDHLPNSKLRGDSKLLIFTQSSWLTLRPSFKLLRDNMLSSFDCLGGLLFNSQEFFDVKGKFPIAFTIWSYKNEKTAKEYLPKTIGKPLKDLTWLKKEQLQELLWGNEQELNKKCLEIINDKRSIDVFLDIERYAIKDWINQNLYNFIRNRRIQEIGLITAGGLPYKDYRRNNKCAYGETMGTSIGFMDNLTPCRITKNQKNIPWFRLNSQFMDCKRTRCFSGPTDQKSYYVSDQATASKIFLWFALARTFAQIGYPLWANQLKLWTPETADKLHLELTKYSYAIGFAENECVETMFPANNPVNGAPEIYCINPLAPTNPESFWSKIMAGVFEKNGNTLPNQLVQAVNNLYVEWSSRFKLTPGIVVTYEKPYFIGEGILKSTAGIIQIRDYAKETNDTKLLELYSTVKELLVKTKQSFYEMLIDPNGINYFGTSKNVSNVIPIKRQKISMNKDDEIKERRLVLAGVIVNSLSDSHSFGRNKYDQTK